MIRSPYRQRSTRYRGSRGSAKWLVLGILAVAVLVGGIVWFLRAGPAGTPTPPPTPMPTETTPTPVPSEEPAAASLPPPPQVRGIYISGPVAGDPYMDTLIELIDSTELNAVVIDIKNDEGNLTYLPTEGMALELGVCIRYIRDLPALISTLKDHGIYTIARISAFKDPLLAAARPELALRRADGSPVSESGGLAWVNPYEQGVWDYLTEIALGAAEMGFDEVQFDYVRFPTGKDMQALDYGPAAEGVSREDVVVKFLETVTDALHAEGVWVSADVFGTVIDSRLDGGIIGQDYARMAEVVDAICPMVYPSHYAAGTFGLEVPDREPYQTVLAAMGKSRETLAGVEEEHRAGVRAWLQAFTATWVKGHLSYGGEELRAQIQAVYDAGYTDWILWNARNSYSRDGLLSPEGD